MMYRIIHRDADAEHATDVIATLDDVTAEFAESIFETARSKAKAGDWLRLESNADGGIVWRKVRSLTIEAPA